MLACAMWNIQSVYAQDPITFIDENGEKVSYGEQKEWTRTIEYVFPDDSSKNHTVYQTTTGNEVWITNQSGAVEYHIGNNGECGWESVSTPYVEGYTADIQTVPDVDLYWHPEYVYNDHVTVIYTQVHSAAEATAATSTLAEENIVPETTTEPDTTAEPEKSEEPSAPQKTEAPAETVEEKTEEKSGIDWVIPGAIGIAGGISAVAYAVIKKLNLSGEEDDE